MLSLQSNRHALGISQSRVARISGVSRFKICTYELGEGSLTMDEQNRIRCALQAEVDRLRRLSANIEFEPLPPGVPDAEVQ
jgi:transcriptional regulator with XRE-family HTH domain